MYLREFLGRNTDLSKSDGEDSGLSGRNGNIQLFQPCSAVEKAARGTDVVLAESPAHKSGKVKKNKLRVRRFIDNYVQKRATDSTDNWEFVEKAFSSMLYRLALVKSLCRTQNGSHERGTERTNTCN